MLREALNWWPVVAFFLIVIVVVFRPREPQGANESMSFNRQYGKYRVKYPEGYYSQPFCKDVAEDYAKMFNGVVVPVTEYRSMKEVRDAKDAEGSEADTSTGRPSN